jgi:hypothetical protein
MIKKLLIIWMMLAFSSVLNAQDEGVLAMQIKTDQHVYMVGESIWIQGDGADVKSISKFVEIQLLDRNGTTRAEVKFINNNGKFSGYLEVPKELRSDFYFLDCSVKGMASKVQLSPVAIINELYPPLSCQQTGFSSFTTPQGKQQFLVSTDRNAYGIRSLINVELTGLENASDIVLSVKRKDKLSDYVDSMINFNTQISVHTAKGEPDREGHVIKARVFSGTDGTPQKNILVYASIVGDRGKISSAISDEKGGLNFILPIVYDDSKIVFSVAEAEEKLYKIEMDEDSDVRSGIVFPCLQLSEGMRTSIEERLLSRDISKGFYSDKTMRKYSFDSDTTDFYGKPDARYILDEYIRFPDMKEILLEFVPEVRVRNPEAPKPIIQILNDPYKAYFTKNSYALLDGVLVKNTKDLFAMDPLLIRSIDVVSRKFILGQLQINGIINYKTYTKDLAGFSLTPNDVIYPFKGVQRNARPIFPIYTAKQNDHLPDFRNLLYQVYDAALSKNEKKEYSFYTSDAKGQYIITITGKDAAGSTISAERTFSVN